MNNIKKRIVLLSQLYPEDSFNLILSSKSKINISTAAQRFYNLIINGLNQHPISLISISILPYRVKKYIKKSHDFISMKSFASIFFYDNSSYLKFPTYLIVFILTTIKILFSNSDFIITETLNKPIFLCAYYASKFLKKKIIGIFTDLPSDMGDSLITLNKKYNNLDGYILMTSKMNDLLNLRNKPFIIIPGLIQTNKYVKQNISNIKFKVMLYAGNLDKKYGISEIINAFISSKLYEWQFHIYGKGDYENDIQRIVKQHLNIKYFGFKSHQYIMQRESKADLLINPRPLVDTFINYSFPSKLLEYISSGTPLLSTRIPYIPDELIPFINFYDQTDLNMVVNSLKLIAKANKKKLLKNALIAKKLVDKNYGLRTQTGKIISFLEEIE